MAVPPPSRSDLDRQIFPIWPTLRSRECVLSFGDFSFLLPECLILQAPKAWAARAAGIDVSDFQGNMTQADWNSVFNAGKMFAWSKATEGGTFTATTFANNMNEGTAAGVYMGAYHYAHPETNAAATDAAHFVAVAGPYLTNGHLRPMLDIEGNAFTLSTADPFDLDQHILHLCDRSLRNERGSDDLHQRQSGRKRS